MELICFDDALVAFRRLDAPVDEETLAPGERGLVDAARSERRRAELLGGRAAARAAFEAAGLARPPAVLSHPGGRPRLEPPLDDWHVSIAHDGELVAAAVARAPLGVDLLVTDRFEAASRVVQHRLDSGRARALPPHAPLPWPDAALSWTAWEALGKIDGRGILPAMNEPIALERVADEVRGSTSGARLRWWSQADALWCLAIATT